LTVVTPSLNQGQFLEEAIRSVLDQAYPYLEYVVMDGGSTDGSTDIIRKYEKHLTYWTSSRDEGQSDALMKGFSRGTGEWLAWLNADDSYLPGAFVAFADAASRAGKDTALLFGAGEVLDDQQQRRKFWPHPAHFDRAALLYGLDYIMQPATFFRRSALDSVGPLRRDYHYCMDYDLWLRLSAQFEVEVIDHPIAVSREHETTKTSLGGFRRWIEIQSMIASHAQVHLTPGLIDYLVQTLYPLTKNDSAHISPVVRRCLMLLLQENAAVARSFCSSGDWFPDGTASRGKIDDRVKEVLETHRSFFDEFEDLKRAFARAEADGLARLKTVEKLEKQLKESDVDRNARLEAVNKLEKQLQESEADRDARLNAINQLTSQLAESERDRAARLDVMQDLQRRLEESDADRAARLQIMNQLGQQIQDLSAELQKVSAELAETRKYDVRTFPVAEWYFRRRKKS